ncbi:DUF4192 family protein [Gulosibacter sp. 10]|uniref:DUF4192 family protein n=1 Tax=Gulosibacter sp. 10 TaxID=1255570 RepID=UPI000B34F562|nr:DUF4192 family protein [Gulosibacter sp. 10]
MNQPKHIRTAADVLVASVEMVGYFPCNSIVLIPYAHRHGRACLRMDLPADEAQIPPEEYAAAVMGNLLQLRDADRVLISVFTDSPIGERETPFAEHALAIAEMAAFAGLRVEALLCRGSNRWRSYVSDEHGGLEALDRATSGAVKADLAEFARIPEADPALERSLRGLLAGEYPPLRQTEIPVVLDAWENLLDARSGELEGFDQEHRLIAFALVALAFRSARATECLLANAVYGEAAAEDLQRVWHALDAADEPVDGLISEQIEIEPIRLERAAAGAELLRTLVGALPPEDAANALAALSWLEWARGSSTLAGHFAEHSIRLGSAHRLPHRVLELSESGITPGWVRQAGCSGGFRQEDFDRLLEASE